MIEIDKTTYRSAAANERPTDGAGAPPKIDALVFHYTSESLATSSKACTRPEARVSVHYIVSPPDPGSPPGSPANAFQLVNDRGRAWHAGSSAWQGKTNLNNKSIGILIVNPCTRDAGSQSACPLLSQAHIDAIVKVTKPLVTQYSIHPTRVVGHSDIRLPLGAIPQRGTTVPWKALAAEGVGAWPDAQAVQAKLPTADTRDVGNIQRKLKKFGYEVIATGVVDEQTQHAVQAFRQHFQPEAPAGITPLMVATLEALVEQYDSFLSQTTRANGLIQAEAGMAPAAAIARTPSSVVALPSPPLLAPPAL